MKHIKYHVNHLLRLSVVMGAGLALPICAEPLSSQASMDNNKCFECHKEKIHKVDFEESVHKGIFCTSCHIETTHKESPEKKSECIASFLEPECSSCHAEQSKEYESSVHNSQRLPIPCAQCHQDIHTIKTKKDSKIASAEQCATCHSRSSAYFESAHFRALKEDKNDAATCTDCHGVHSISKLNDRATRTLFHTEACIKCHADEPLMEKNKQTPIAAKTYFDSYHGKNVRLGYPEKVAGCSDCHSAHAILEAKDPNSTIHAQNLTKTCTQCHKDASESFTKFIAHADHSDAKSSPALYWTFVFMTSLLVGTFIFFWLHTVLWAMRAFIEKHDQARALSFPDIKSYSRFLKKNHEVHDAKKLYHRFRPIHIVLHVAVVSSFLALALTGLPLKFSGTGWGQKLMTLLGGPVNAGLIHRIGGVVTIGYFIVALIMGIHFLFFDKRQKGTFREKFFGPDSLCPNRRDLRDLKAMFKWFFFRGPKPVHERWTYWEKFDFLAVFWGVAVIGSSGLMLWFPSFFSLFLPGWMFNLATIIHSDEALLATGFIFTVHFFNTQFRPDKFPFDFVVFHGHISKEELLTERTDQWERYQKDGVIEDFEVKKPTPLLWAVTYRIFAVTALALGLILAALIVYSLVT